MSKVKKSKLEIHVAWNYPFQGLLELILTTEMIVPEVPPQDKAKRLVLAHEYISVTLMNDYIDSINKQYLNKECKMKQARRQHNIVLELSNAEATALYVAVVLLNLDDSSPYYTLCRELQQRMRNMVHLLIIDNYPQLQ